MKVSKRYQKFRSAKNASLILSSVFFLSTNFEVTLQIILLLSFFGKSLRMLAIP